MSTQSDAQQAAEAKRRAAEARLAAATQLRVAAYEAYNLGAPEPSSYNIENMAMMMMVSMVPTDGLNIDERVQLLGYSINEFYSACAELMLYS